MRYTLDQELLFPAIGAWSKVAMDDSTPASLITSQTRAEASNPDDAQCEALDEEVAAIRAQSVYK